ncbi:MAG: hypothetical protein E6P95_03950 [Candidatus Moraniibacteriota bacterium]|nr:MAG: hypothetical protein E6P95_03950 [Candidatus Moranbacteria bacterium]
MEMPPSILFILNVVIIALAGAIIEIVMEKENGWGGALDKKTWYGKVIGENNRVLKFLARSAGVPYFFGYAIAMYFVLVPSILLFEYTVFDQSIVFFIVIYFSILALEDFTWFLLNPYFHSLRELLKGPNGSIWWHKKWVKIGNQCYLPKSYFISIVVVLTLLILNQYI